MVLVRGDKEAAKFFRPRRVYRGALSREVSLYYKKSIFAGKSTLVNAP